MGKMSEVNKPNRKVKIRPDGSVQVVTINDQPSKTDQSFAEQTNINHIMKKYRAYGFDYNTLPDVAKGVYGDFTNVKDYQQALDASLNVQKAFNSLPADIRKRFYNDPQKLNEFLGDAKNLDEAIQLGLIKKPTPSQLPPEPKNANDDKTTNAK